MSEAVTKTIVGQCEEISEKNGWTSFSVNVGSQYPVRLSTKVAAIIEQGRAVGTDIATWTFKESQGGENPNKPGTYYTNRYLDKVEIGGETIPEPGGLPAATSNTGVTAAPQRPAVGEHAPLAVGDRERSIVRQACLKAAATIYQGRGAENKGQGTDDAPVWQDEAVTLTIMAASRMEMWVMRDIDEVPFE